MLCFCETCYVTYMLSDQVVPGREDLCQDEERAGAEGKTPRLRPTSQYDTGRGRGDCDGCRDRRGDLRGGVQVDQEADSHALRQGGRGHTSLATHEDGWIKRSRNGSCTLIGFC